MLRQKCARILGLLLIVMVAAVFWRGWLVHRQSTLDRALIAAVTNDDAAATAVLLAEGADSNAKDWHEREAHCGDYRHLTPLLSPQVWTEWSMPPRQRATSTLSGVHKFTFSALSPKEPMTTNRIAGAPEPNI